MPEGITTTAGTTARVSESGFVWPPEVPWSQLGPDFIETYGHDENGQLRAEHMEATGQSGSGKSYSIATILQQRAARWNTAELAIVTKQTDDSIPLLGWPVVTSYRELQEQKYRQAVFWPQTTLKGSEREQFHEQQIYELLSNLWPDPGQVANIVLYLDEVRYIESLSSPAKASRQRLKKLVRMYWREGRSHGISLIAGAQRPVEMVRDQHSESRWKICFPPADQADMQRFAELLGRWQDWRPVLESLDQARHQFVLKNTFTNDAFITWIDSDLHPLPSQTPEGQKKARRQGKAEGE